MLDDLPWVVFDAASEAMCITRADDGGFLRVNEAFCRATGYAADEVTGRPIGEVGVWADAAERTAMLAILDRDGVAEDLTVHMRRKDGSIRILSVNVRAIELDGQRCVLTAGRDVTERTLAEHALSVQARREQTIADLGVIALRASGIEPVLATVTRVAQETLAADGCTLYRFATGAGSAAVLTTAGRSLAAGDQAELLAAAARGGDRLVTAAGTLAVPVEDEQGGRFGLLAVTPGNAHGFAEPDGAFLSAVANVVSTALQRVARETRLRESEARFRDVLTTIELPTVVLDREGVILFANAAHAAYAGVTPEELEGKMWLDLFAMPDARGDRDRRYPSELRDGAISDYTAPLRTSSGGERMIHWHNVILRDADGSVYGSASIGEDVTERSALESRLRDSERRREQVLAELLRVEAEERARIAGDLHDDSVQVMVASLLRLDQVEMALRAGGQGNAMVALAQTRDLLAQAIERTRRLTFDLRPALLEGQGVESAVRALAERFRADADWNLTVDVDLARYSAQVEQLAYRTMLEALTNIRKHAGAQNVTITMQEGVRVLTGSVVDDGCGFDVEVALKRARTTSHLGLDTMVERVRLAGGTLTVSSKPGAGTSIAFSIPLWDERAIAGSA